MSLAAFFRAVLDAVAPPRESDLLVRVLSREDLRRITLRGERAGSLPYHDPRVRALVWEIKYYAHARAAMLAGEVLAQPLIGIASECLGTPLLIPLPMHTARRRQRGHNQTEVLCSAALPHVQTFFTYAPRVLVRARHSAPQQGLSRQERLHNIEGSMKVADTAAVVGRTCVVVDDVSTTGATFAEATRALKAAGAAHVECVALAYS